MGSLIQAFCALCRRTAYVHVEAEMACPVCSSPLVDVADSDESQAG
jgi:Zn finger protein HypA/HybF involved in hydrogenase expression